MPTLLPETEMGELLNVEVPVKTGNVPEVPVPVTCAAALIANAAMQNANPIICLRMVLLSFRSRFVDSRP